MKEVKRAPGKVGRLLLTCVIGVVLISESSRGWLAAFPPVKAQERPRGLGSNSPAGSPRKGGIAQTLPGLTVTDLTSPQNSPLGMANTILGDGLTITNVTYTGAATAAGVFSGGTGIVGFEQGIVLSSGSAQNVAGPNQSPNLTQAYGLPGDSQLNELVPGLITFDAAVLEFDFMPFGDVISFQYVFSSDEYNEFVGSQFNDVFGFFLNGRNVALVPGTTLPVAINNVNGGKPFGNSPVNPQFYLNNDLSDGGATINTQMDGLTVVLTVEAPVNAGQVNHIKLAIADASDAGLDSNVFIKASSFKAAPSSRADLAVSQVATPSQGQVGSTASFAITVTNSGPDVADAFAVSDNLPASMTVVSCSASGGGVCGGSGSNRIISFQSVPPGGSVTANLVATVGCPAGGLPDVVNAVRVNSATFDPNQSNNTASATINVVTATNPINLIEGGGSIDFGVASAAREPGPNSPSKFFTLENTGCPSGLSVFIDRVGSDIDSGKIINPDDSARFLVSMIDPNGTETPLPVGPGAAQIELPGAQSRRFRVQFNPLIPILSGRNTGLVANQALPESIVSRLTIVPNGRPPLTLGLAGRVATLVKLIHPLDPRLSPLITFTRSGDQFEVEYSIHDPNLDINVVRYQFLDQDGKAVGAPVDAQPGPAITQANLVKGQSITVAQRFTGAASQPRIARVQVTVFDLDGNDTAVSAPLGTVEARVASVSAASFSEPVASESIIAAFGTALAAATDSALTTPLPTVLGNSKVLIRDGAGVERESPLFYVSPNQINYQIPAGTMLGAATVSVIKGGSLASLGMTQIIGSSPGLFAADGSGQGVAAAQAIRVAPDGALRYDQAARFDQGQNRFVSVPIDFGSDRDQVFLVLYGTGIRQFNGVTVRIGGIQVPVSYAGPQGGFVGLDQVNVLLPRTLRGRGEVDVVLTAGGKTANTVKVNLGGAIAMARSEAAVPAPKSAAPRSQGYQAITTINLPVLDLGPAEVK